MNFDENVMRAFFLINHWWLIKLMNYKYTKIQRSCFCYMYTLSPTTRNEYMALTSGEKRAMKKVGYHIYDYKIIPLSIVRELSKFK